MKKIILVMVLPLLFFLIYADQPFKVDLTKDEEDYLERTGEITICVNPDRLPYEYVDTTRGFTGITADLLELVSKRIGVSFKFIPTKDWNETLDYSRSGKCLIVPVSDQPGEKKEWLSFTEPLFAESYVFVTASEHPYIAEPSLLTGKTVVLPDDKIVEEIIRSHYPGLKIIKAATGREAFAAVLDRSADLTLSGLSMSAYTIRKEGFFNLKIAGQVPDYKNNLRIGVLENHEMLRQILNRGIASITSGDRDEIINRHVNIEIKPPLNYPLIAKVTAVLSLIAVFVFYWIYKLRNLNRMLAESEERNRLLSEVTMEGIVVHKDGTPVEVNRALLNITGYSRDELVGYNFIEKVIHPEYREAVTARMSMSYTGPQEVRIVKKNRSEIFVEIEAYSFKWQGRDYRVSAIRDIDEKLKTHRALKESEEKLQAIFDIANIGVSITDKDGRYAIFNKWWCDYLGYNEDELLEKTNLDVTHPEDIEKSRDFFNKVVSGEIDRYRFEKRFLRKDGAIVWGDLSVSSVRDDDGEVVYMVGMINDISLKKRMETGILAAKEKAEEASRSKSEFLANMSHELRTPLNGVIGFSDLLVKTELDSEQSGYARNINTSARSLLGVINDILDFSKIESGKMEILYSSNNIRQIADQVIDIVKYQALEKSLELIVNIAPDVPSNAVVDPLRLNQILVNLLGNAVKFTHEGSVELGIEFEQTGPAEGVFSFYVQDTGIGIGENEQKILFKAFTQADSSATRKFGGTGLGLAISAKLAEAMGSRIELESETGKGSKFFFKLETGFESASTEREPVDTAELQEKERERLSDKPSIVVAENDPMSMLLVKTLIKKLLPEAAVIEAKNGREALQAVMNEKPGIVFMDVQMPEMDGLEATREIRLLEKGGKNRVPVIALSAGVIKEEQDTCIKAGMDDFLPKPVDRELLKKVLGRYLR